MELIRQGLSSKEVAAAVPCNSSLVTYARRCLGLPLLQRRMPSVDSVVREAEVKRLRAQGATLSSIGKRYGLTRQSIDQILNAEKKAARSLINHLIARGRITRPKFCSWCGSSVDIEAHHPAYEYPMFVLWLCADCHTQVEKADNQNHK